MSAGDPAVALAGRLGLRPGQRVFFERAPSERWVEVPDGTTILGRAAPELDVVVTFVLTRRRLAARIAVLRSRLAAGGVLWAAWRESRPGIVSHLTEDRVREVARAGGLVDGDVMAIDARWSAMRLVVGPEPS